MDHRIYGRLNRADLGVYGTRRYPKGVGSGLVQNPVAASDPINRNPLTVTRVYRVANQAAGAGTIDAGRWEYTVPPRRRAVFQALEVELARSLAGAGNTMSYAAIYLTRAGGSPVELVRVTSHDDVVGSRDREVHTGILELYEGDKLNGSTSVVNGNMSFQVTAHGIEYDAEERITGQDVSQLGAEPSGGAGSRGSGYSAIGGIAHGFRETNGTVLGSGGVRIPVVRYT